MIEHILNSHFTWPRGLLAVNAPIIGKHNNVVDRVQLNRSLIRSI